MLNPVAVDALREAGISVSAEHEEAPVNPSLGRPDLLVAMRVGEDTIHFAVEVKMSAPYPSQMERLDPIRDRLRNWGLPLLHAPHISEGQGRALTSHGWSWVDELGNFDLRSKGMVLRNRVHAAKREGRRSANALPKGPGGLRVVRILIANPPQPPRTSVIAQIAQVSTPRTSQVLHQLRTHGFASKRADDSWEIDRAALLDLFMADYPGPGGRHSWFYSLDVSAAARRIARLWENEPAISGDVAADFLVPHRRPSHLVAYLRLGTIDENDTMVAVSSETEANISVTWPRDASVFPAERLEPLAAEPIVLADAVQVAWDLQQLGGEDRLDQLERLKTWILNSR